MFIYQNTNDLFYIAHKRDTLPNLRHFYGHTHGHYEVFLFIGGNASFNIEGNVFRLSPYDILVIPPHHYHCLIVNSLVPYERFVLEIPDGRIEHDWCKLFLKPSVFSLSEDHALISCFQRLERYFSLLSYPDFGKMCEHLVQETLLLLKAAVGADTAGHSYDPLTKRILSYINEHIEEPLSARSVADSFFLSPSHIQNVFYQNMKIGIKSYIVQKKMLRAKELLQSGKKPCEVAAQLGYGDYATFFKAFRKEYGTAPKSFYIKR